MGEHVGSVLKKLREERGLSKSRLSREAAVSNAYVVQIEKGQRSPSEEILYRFARALRVPPHALLIAANMISNDELVRAHEYQDHVIDEWQKHDRTVDDDLAERFFAIGLGFANERGAFEPGHRSFDPTEPYDPFAMPPDRFWGWDAPTPVLPLEHWNNLSAGDRRLVQRLANRLAHIEGPEV